MQPDASLTWKGMAMVEPLPYGPASTVPMVIVCAIAGVNANASIIIIKSKLLVRILFMENRRSGSVGSVSVNNLKCEKVKCCKKCHADYNKWHFIRQFDAACYKNRTLKV